MGFRYDSRTGTHNAYKEYREVALTDAVNSLYQNMAGLSRAKAASIQILRTSELKAECKRPNIVQFHTQKIKFPLAHRIIKTPKAYKTTFKASSAKTFSARWMHRFVSKLCLLWCIEHTSAPCIKR